MRQLVRSLLFFSIMIGILVVQAAGAQGFRLGEIELPEGFGIEVYARDIPTARGMDFAPDGTLFVGSKNGGVYAVSPGGGQVRQVTRNLAMPVGLDFFEGDLYVSAISRIVVYRDVLERLEKTGSGGDAEVVSGRFPGDRAHGWKFIKFGPDGKLYVPVGAPCNVCDPENPIYSTITRMNPDGSDFEIVAAGIRNTVGFDWDPWTGELWFTDNGRDRMGDNVPPDELNRVTKEGSHYGFPYRHGRIINDPEFWGLRPRVTSFVPPELELPAHVAALGMRFYDGETFPMEYRGDIFIAEHGSWNRSEKIGYRITRVEIDRSGAEPVAGEYSVFAEGWLQGERAWGRPADVEIGPDGALYVSDDVADAVYRIFYWGP